MNHSFYLYNDRLKTFRLIRDGSVCGRSEGDIQFSEDDLVSQRQLQFTVAGNEVYVEDYNSTNKTRINGVHILPGRKRRIRLNDVIEFGLQRMVMTHQNAHAPGGTPDLQEKIRIFKAAKRNDGSLTMSITKVVTRTRVHLDRASFRRLRVKRQVVDPVRTHAPFLLCGMSLLLGSWLWTLF
ncbi:MAG: FHA domain-containing protein [Methylotenera sp.]|nr:FHA domain-containing protein [Oligoflexia bacterium]